MLLECVLLDLNFDFDCSVDRGVYVLVMISLNFERLVSFDLLVGGFFDRLLYA